MTENLQELPGRLLNWYRKTARILPWREEPTAYRVWVSEIMLQQTRVEAVKPYFERFMQALPSVPYLAEAEEEQLLKLWEGLGYYNRVRNMQRAAEKVMDAYSGELPGEYEKLLTLPGIGPYTAGAIASIAFSKRVPAVDGNVLRVFARITENRGDILKPAVKKEITNILCELLPEDKPGDFNQALMELGAVVCIPNGAPHCKECPVSELCMAHKHATELLLPVKAPKKKREIEKRTVFLLVHRDTLAVKKRGKSGLLAGLWELPNVEGEFQEGAANETLQGWGITPLSMERTEDAKHIFTHKEWHMSGVFVEAKETVSAFQWVTLEEMKTAYALPSAFRHFQEIFEEKAEDGL